VTFLVTLPAFLYVWHPNPILINRYTESIGKMQATDVKNSSLETANDSVEFKKGDRIVISGIQAVGTGTLEQHGRRHGHIVAVGSQSCALHLDAGNGSGQFQTVLVSQNRIKREQSIEEMIPLSCTVQNRATVENGALVNGRPIHDGQSSTYHTAAMIGLMHLIRWMAATTCYKGPTNELAVETTTQCPYNDLSFAQVQCLPTDDCHLLNASAIKNWGRLTDTPGVRDRCVQYMNSQGIESGFVFDALSDTRAMRTWQRCIQQEFWFVGKDDMGTYVVPDLRSHEHVVYKVVGFGGPSSSDKPVIAASPVRLIKIPMRLRITILPWYGRLLHDTSIPLPRQESIVTANDPIKANRLHSVVLQAIQSGAVIEHFAELENMK
jgi:hypothetical protein